MPSERNLRRRRAAIKAGMVREQGMDYRKKMVANKNCVFCGVGFGGHYLTICIHCRCCQYCGLVIDHGDICKLCGNTPDKDTARPKPIRIRASQVAQEGRKIKRRTVRRIGPQSRRRAL